MIDDALIFLKNNLNTHLSLSRDPKGSFEDLVVFMDGDKMESMAFKMGAVTILLLNVEEEKTLRSPDLYSRTGPDGKRRDIDPEIRLNLSVLFIAHFKLYEDSLNYLSQILRHFQRNRVFTHENAPGMSDKIEKLVLELNTFAPQDQNFIWSALRRPYHPSVLYKVTMLVFRGAPEPEAPAVEKKSLDISQ